MSATSSENLNGQNPQLDAETVRMIKETHLAVVGDTKLGVPGLVSRMDTVERDQRKTLTYALFGAGAVSGAALGLKGIITSLFSK